MGSNHSSQKSLNTNYPFHSLMQEQNNYQSHSQNDKMYQSSINQIHSKLGLLSIKIFEQVRLELLKKGYKIIDYISKGGQAEVFKGYSDSLKKECAIRLSANTADGYQSLLKEFETIKHIKQPLNIVELFAVEFFEDIQICAHILELCQFSLEDEMQNHKNNNTWFDEKQQYFIIFSLCDSLNEIQSYEIIHFDIKPSNVLKTMKGEYVLSDFGMSKRIPKNQTHINKVYGFSYIYISPEQYQNLQDQNENNVELTKISYQSDLFSMSLLLLQILEFKVDIFFSHNIREEQFQNIVLEENKKIIFDQFKKSLLVKEPNQRLEAQRLQQFFLSILDIKNKDFLEQYQKKIEMILYQNKYDNSKNILFSAKLHQEYSFTHFYISQILGNQFQEIISLDFIGDSFFRNGQFNKAIEYFWQSLEMNRLIYKGNHPSIARNLNNISLCYENEGLGNKGLKYCLQSLEMNRSLYQGNHIKIANSLDRIGVCYELVGDDDLALECHLESFEIKKSLLKENNDSISQSLVNLSVLYRRTGKITQALDYAKQSLDMYQSLYQGNHPVVAACLNNIGLCHLSLGNIVAFEYFLNSLDMMKFVLQENHPTIERVQKNLISCLQKFGLSQNTMGYVLRHLQNQDQSFIKAFYEIKGF